MQALTYRRHHHRVYRFEKRSIYTDNYFLTNPIRLFYGRYVDDAGSLTKSKQEAENMLQLISDQDPGGLLKCEIDYPAPGQFTPFLDAEIMIDTDGTLHHKYYRKPQKKNITLHLASHHPTNTKIQTVKNFYQTAATCSSNPGTGTGKKPTPGTKLVEVIIIDELMEYTQLTATKWVR